MNEPRLAHPLATITSRAMTRTIKRFLAYSLRQGDSWLAYEELTEAERALCTEQEYGDLMRWIAKR